MSSVEKEYSPAADPGVPLVAVSGDTGVAVEALTLLLSECGFELFPDEYKPDMDSIGTRIPDILVIDVAESDTAAQVSATLQDWRSKSSVPVLCLFSLSGNLKPDDIGHLYVDDYLLKPVRPEELKSRIRIILRRRLASQGTPLVERRNRSRRKEDRSEPPVTHADGHCLVDEANKCVILDGRELNLSPKEYELFCLLLDNKGRILSPREIIERVWPEAERASASDVHQYMHLLRRKVEPELSRPRWIVTVRGFGYKLVVPNPM